MASRPRKAVLAPFFVENEKNFLEIKKATKKAEKSAMDGVLGDYVFLAHLKIISKTFENVQKTA